MTLAVHDCAPRLRAASIALLAVSIALLVSTAGCMPRTIVRKDPGPRDKGVRYYRPKPYLMVKPMVDDTGRPVAGHVSIEPITLPDYSEEYSIHVRSGVGTNNTSIKLEDGWKLTGLDINIDSKTSENLKAIGDLISAVPTEGGGDTRKMAIPALNVPLGLYEAVVSEGADCRKRLYGFRYVGFLPYASCPLEACGADPMSCHEGQVYGLVFDRNVGGMVFKLLHEIPHDVGPALAIASEAEDDSQVFEDTDAQGASGGDVNDDLLAPLPPVVQ